MNVTLHSQFEESKFRKRITTHHLIVNVSTGDMLREPELVGGDTHAKMMSSIKDLTDDAEEQEVEDDVDHFALLSKIKFNLHFTSKIVSLTVLFY